jgi:hypothetical protein
LRGRDHRHVDGFALGDAFGDGAKRRVADSDLVPGRLLEFRQHAGEHQPKGNRAYQFDFGRLRGRWRHCKQQQTNKCRACDGSESRGNGMVAPGVLRCRDYRKAETVTTIHNFTLWAIGEHNTRVARRGRALMPARNMFC